MVTDVDVVVPSGGCCFALLLLFFPLSLSSWDTSKLSTTGRRLEDEEEEEEGILPDLAEEAMVGNNRQSLCLTREHRKGKSIEIYV